MYRMLPALSTTFSIICSLWRVLIFVRKRTYKTKSNLLEANCVNSIYNSVPTCGVFRVQPTNASSFCVYKEALLVYKVLLVCNAILVFRCSPRFQKLFLFLKIVLLSEALLVYKVHLVCKGILVFRCSLSFQKLFWFLRPF